MNYRRALNRIGQEIGQRDLSDLKFACRDVIDESRSEHIHAARDLFIALEERNLLSQDKLDYLARRLSDIGRAQLLSHFEAFGFHVPDLSRPPVSGSPTGDTETDAAESSFTKCLLTISQKLNSDEVDRLAFAWCNHYLNRTVDQIFSANQLFTLMNQRLVITPDNLQVLYIELSEMGRRDLCKIIEEYYQIMGINQQPYNSTIPHAASPTPSNFSSRGSREENMSGYPSTQGFSQDPYYMQFYNGQHRPMDLHFPPSPASFNDLHSQISSISHQTANISLSPPPGLLTHYGRKESVPENHPVAKQWNGYVDQRGSPRPSSAASGSNDGSPAYGNSGYPKNPNPNVLFSTGFDVENENGLEMQVFKTAEPTQEIHDMQQQLIQERTIQEHQPVQNIELLNTHQIEIQQLQEALQHKNQEVTELYNRIINPSQASLSTAPLGELYPMDKDPHGYCIIINNYNFHQVSDQYEQLTNRGGAQVDQRNLVTTFTLLKYKVEEYVNLTSEEMIDTLKNVSSRDHSNFDSFVCCILTHGEEGQVFGADSVPVDLRDLTGLMKGTFTRSLLNKPKLFFIQACRGELEEKGIPIEKDGDTSLPAETDFLFGYATPTGKAAYRSRRHGSWFISELCQVFQDNAHLMPLGAMMKKVNSKVSDAYTKEGYKQCSEVVDRLRKDVLFFPL